MVAMYLSKIKQTAGAELKLPVQDVCLSVPPWFTDVQRRALIDAAEIAGLRVLRLINDGTAAALGWGITKLDLPAPEEAPRPATLSPLLSSRRVSSLSRPQPGTRTSVVVTSIALWLTTSPRSSRANTRSTS
ncbi:hypothetical protein LB505_004174 [Fusarium chuoi]|nr:hypothetical protein LB505_004174 [Fusarium chuoi]